MSEATPDSEKNNWHHQHSTNAMRMASADRTATMDARSNSTSGAYTRHPDVKTSTFVPFEVRAAGFRRQGYNVSEARRMAQYQTRSAGLDNPLSDRSGNSIDPRHPTMRNDVVGSGQGIGPHFNQQGSASGATFQAPQAGQPQQGGGAPRTMSAIEQAQANYDREREAAMSSDDPAAKKAFLQKRNKAKAFAKSKGWIFDPDKGYSNPGVNDPGYRDTVSVASRPKRPKPTQQGGGSATFTMPDGSTQVIGDFESVGEGFDRIRNAPKPAEQPTFRQERDLERESSMVDDLYKMTGRERPESQFEGIRADPQGGTSSVSAASSGVGTGASISPTTTAKDTRTFVSIDQPSTPEPENGAFKTPARKVPKAKDILNNQPSDLEAKKFNKKVKRMKLPDLNF